MSLHDIWRGDIMPLSGVIISMGRNSFDPPAPVVPFYDIHNKLSSINVSTASGDLFYNSDLRQLDLIPNNSGSQSIVLGSILDVYRADVDEAISDGTYTDVTFDTVRINTDPANYELRSSGIIQVHSSGTYDITYRISCESASVATLRVTLRSWLQKLSPIANETGFSEITGTSAWFYLHNAASGDDTKLVKCIIKLQAEDMIQSVVQGWSGVAVDNVTVVADGCGLTIEKLE